MEKKRYEEDDFEGFVQDLINSGRLDDKEIGISKLMLDKGYDNLSEKQKYVFDKAIEKNSVEYCDFCSTPISWCEMMEALDNGGLCIGCQHTKKKKLNVNRNPTNQRSATQHWVALLFMRIFPKLHEHDSEKSCSCFIYNHAHDFLKS